VKVAQLSRFNTGKATQQTLKGMADGTVDIVIGTHKLVQPDITFKNLGLVIIDEEHRFGVRQKEQLKRLRANVDMLTLTATPIPRTLSMALEGLRDFSLITTAPSRRLAVKTFVKPFSEASIREAMLRELKRGGQVFFLHNEVDTIENMHERLAELLPEARIGVAHGQLRERELEQVMRDFLQQRFNVLLCSTIIETGIDIPNANTIIINRADKFGLAQLHQLRGRVGRSHHQAYAYLLTPEYITKDAEKRLDAIAAADDLGAGFTLAMQDLEIRGAGEILGEGQSGEMMQVGFSLYTEMLKQAVRELKKGRVPDLDAPLGVTTDIKLHSPALVARRLLPRHPRALGALQAPGHLRNRAANQRRARRAGRPLRPARAAGENPARKPPPAPGRQRAGHRRHRRHRRSRHLHLRQRPQHRPRRNYSADANQQKLPPRRAG
jgi:transcription-repair coupling factor (superfamily II helicase)